MLMLEARNEAEPSGQRGSLEKFPVVFAGILSVSQWWFVGALPGVGGVCCRTLAG